MKPVIVLFADSTTILKHYAEGLKKKNFQIVWWICHQSVAAELKKINQDEIFFSSLQFSLFPISFLNKIVNRIIISLKLAPLYRDFMLTKSMSTLKKKYQPKLVISDSLTLLANIKRPIIPLALAFRTVNFKEHNNIREVLKYDLIFMPSEFQRDTFYKKFQVAPDDKRFPVIGWPRVEELLEMELNESDRNNFFKLMELDPTKKTILYAPTWDSFDGYSLLPKHFAESEEEAFRVFCKKIKELNFNLIIRLHPYMHRHITNTSWRKIAEEHGAFWTNKEAKNHIEDEMVYYLKYADILISDTSGIVTDFMILNKPIIFLEPDHPRFNWSKSDLPPDFRVGPIARSLDHLVDEIAQVNSFAEKYSRQMKETTKTIFSIEPLQARERALLAIDHFLDRVKRV